MAEKTLTYREQVDAKRILQMRAIVRELPQACGDFLNGVALTTGTFTRLAYAIDLRTFFQYLHSERVAWADTPLTRVTDDMIAGVTKADLDAYTEYLTFYFRAEDQQKNDLSLAVVNHEKSIKRKLCALRSMYDYLYKCERIDHNVLELVSLPKIHEKPIIRLDRSEMERILYEASTGEGLTKRQQGYQKKTAKRDFALLSLFLGTGIRVSECVGINLQDVDFEENAFLVTRKGGNQMVLYFPPEVA